MSDPNSFTLIQLKKKLRARGLSTTGPKAELISRLMQEDPTGNWALEEDDTEDNTNHDPEENEGREGTEAAFQDAQKTLQEERNRLLLRELEITRRERDVAQRELTLVQRGSPQANAIRTSTDEVTFLPNNGEGRERRDGNMTGNQLRADVKGIGELLGEFDGTNRYFDDWEKQVRLLKRLFGVNDAIMKIIISSKLKGKAEKWFRSKSDYTEMTLDELMEEMRGGFDQRPKKMDRMKQFEARTWQTSETFNSYYHDKLILANLVPVDEEDLVDYLVDGIANQTLRNQARMQNFSTVKELLTAFQKISLPTDSKERIKRENPVVERKFAGKAADKPLVKTENKSTKGTSKVEVADEKPTLRCYNCNKLGHLSAECRRPKREPGSCFKCGELGHQAKECPKRQPQEKTEVNNVFEDPAEEGSIEHRRIVTYEIKDCELNRVLCLDTLFDTGSAISFLKARFVDKQGFHPLDSSDQNYFGCKRVQIQILGKVFVRVTMAGITRENVRIYVVPEDTTVTPALLGRDVMPKFGIKLTLPTDDEAMREIMNINLVNTDFDITDELKINSEIPYETREALKQSFRDNYVNSQRPAESKTKAELKLRLENPQPFHCTPRPLAFDEKNKLQIILDDLLKKKYIQPSDSEFASPIVLVRKKNGSLRMCVDYRVLNKATARDNYPMPLIEDHLQMLGNKKYFTLLDLKDGFHHVHMAADSVKYTSFVTPLGQYEWLRMPFGLRTAPAMFQRYINRIMTEFVRRGDMVIYMDDILIATQTLDYHLEVLNRVFETLTENLLQLRIEKCFFLQTKIEYLGYVVTSQGIRPTRNGIEAVVKFPIPKSTRDVRSFLGLCSYFRKFIENFSSIAKPLYDLTKSNVIFKFGATENEAFRKLKTKLTEAPILSIYSPSDPTELHCDASSAGFGAILMQKKSDGKMHPVFYFSKRTSEAESKMHSFELETLAIIYALERFRIYLQGIKFKILTDCNAVTMTLKRKDVNRRVERWSIALLNYDYELEYRAGVRMRHVDALSRVVNVIDENPFEWNVTVCQGQDPQIVEIRKMLEKSESKLYELRNGLVYRKHGKGISFYVPKQMEQNVLYKYHDEMGHIGTEKTIQAIQENYWFPSLREKVDSHVRNCLKCITYSPNSGKCEGFIHSIPKGDTPFATLHVDHLGPIDKRRLIKQHIFVVIDSFTKFVKLYPTKTTSSKEAISCLQQYFDNYSRPQVIISDRGSCFTSSEFSDFLRENDVKHTMIATGSPQANGQVERINRTLTPMIAKLSDDSVGKYWYKVIAEAEYAINNSVNRSTGETPSRLLFGVNQRKKNLDKLCEYIQNEKDIEREDVVKLRANASDRILRSQTYNKRYTDSKRKAAHEYSVSDLVMIKNFDSTAGSSHKLKPAFKGPYKISKKLGNDRYVVTDIDGFQNTQRPYSGVWQAANIRPWRNV